MKSKNKHTNLENLIKREKLRCCIDSKFLDYGPNGLGFGLTGDAEEHPELKGKKDISVKNPWIFYPDDAEISPTIVDKSELYFGTYE